jgi:hypothetical protein
MKKGFFNLYDESNLRKNLHKCLKEGKDKNTRRQAVD